MGEFVSNLEQKTDAIIILGTCSSGASVVTGCLHHLGVELGKNLLLDSSNPVDHWGHRDLILIHDLLLRDLGCEWNMIGNLPEGWIESEAAESAKKSIVAVLDRDFRNKGVWAVKDFRLIRFISLWDSLLREMGFKPGYILILRHPWEVAQSLQKNNGFDLLKGHLLWLSQNREALASCHDKTHAILTYDQLLSDPISTMRGVGEQLNLVYPCPLRQQYHHILEFVRSDLKHHYSGEQVQIGAGPVHFNHFAHLYDQFRFHQAGNTLQSTKEELSVIHNALSLEKTAI
jgi:hypothetical protein